MRSIDEAIELKSDEMVLNMGPQHPSTHGVLRLVLKTDGEVVKDVRPVIGYLHRCMEKHSENVTYATVVPYVDRLDYLAAMNNELGYALAVEKLAGIEVPERVRCIRVIVAELNRIASHLIATGVYGLDTGAVTLFLYTLRDRERIMDLFEEIAGVRLLYNYIRVGGLAHDLTPGWVEKVKDFIKYFRPKIQEYNNLVTYQKIFIERTANVGVLEPEIAISYGVTGPNLRGSGVQWDLRKDEPYSGYEKYDFEVPVGKGEMGKVGDSWDRYWVRIREMQESARIVEQALEQLPAEGDVKSAIPKVLKPPEGDVYFRVENPRGDLGFYIVSDGTPKPYRVKVRSPCFTALSVLREISVGWMIADIVAILGSLDIMLGEIDR
ncbi:MAG: NADH-quinone oxidoreductase subunit D [Candidatus Glassbacteria bacterium]